MTDNDDENVEERYNQFEQSLTEYSKSPIENFAAIKLHLLAILKTHRPIKITDYQFGVSKTGRNKHQLIVYDSNNGTNVREYFKSGTNVWHCCECNRIGAAHASESNNLFIKYDIVFAKLKHECTPRKLSFVMEVQKLYKAGRIVEAVALQKDVLGSEDLYMISTKKFAGVKNSKKAVEPINEISWAYKIPYAAEENNESVQEHKPSTMDEQKIQSPEAVYAEIIENLQEYTYEMRGNILAKQPKILDLLKTHRPIKMVDYHYGLMENLHPNRRLIVFEWEDRKRVHEYTKSNEDKYLWRCRDCARMYRRQIKHLGSSLRLINGIVFVPINHSCPPRDYDLVMQYQRFLEVGDITKAHSMALTVDFTFEPLAKKYFKNIYDVKPGDTSENRTEDVDNKRNTKTSANSKRKFKSNDNKTYSDEELPVRKKSKQNKADSDDIVLHENNSVLIDEELPVPKKSKRKKNKENQIDKEIDLLFQMPKANEEPASAVTTPSRFPFEKPTPLMLEEICTKLNIQYRTKAMNIWDRIMLKQIDTESFPNIEPHEFQTENFYEILSKLFTGKSKHHQRIQETILNAFRTKVVDSGEMSARKFDKYFWKDTVTDKHLSFTAKFLPCRIIIYDFNEGEIRRYGKWKETSGKSVTVVLSFSDGLYSTVLNL